jgi:hypothetical protein
MWDSGFEFASEELVALCGCVSRVVGERRARRLTLYQLTLFSSTANVFMASCILSKLVDFQTKLSAKL